MPLCRLVAFSVASPVSPLSVSLASLIQIQLRLQIWSHRQIPIVIQVHFQVQIQVQIQINFRIHVQIQILAQMQVQIQFQVGIQLRTQMQMWFTFSFTFLSGFRFTFSWSCRRQLVQVVCRDLPNGGLGGTLLQRHVCPALAKVRAWIADHLIRNGHNLSSRAFLALARGLMPTLVLPNRSSCSYDTFVWRKQFHSIPAGCLVFTVAAFPDHVSP